VKGLHADCDTWPVRKIRSRKWKLPTILGQCNRGTLLIVERAEFSRGDEGVGFSSRGPGYKYYQPQISVKKEDANAADGGKKKKED